MAGNGTGLTMFFWFSNMFTNIFKWPRMPEYTGKIFYFHFLVRASLIFRFFKAKNHILDPIFPDIRTCFYVLMGFNMLILCRSSPIYYFSLLKPDFCYNFSHFRHILENNPFRDIFMPITF